MSGAENQRQDRSDAWDAQVAPSMVERVARAIASEDGVGSPMGFMPDGRPMRDATWDYFMPVQHGIWRRMARAAIEAMREPTPAMIGDGALVVVGGSINEASQLDIAIAHRDAAEIYVAMIDAERSPDGAASRHTPQPDRSERSEP